METFFPWVNFQGCDDLNVKSQPKYLNQEGNVKCKM